MEKQILGFLDETSCQNTDNSSRIWYKKHLKNTITKNPDRISVTGIGFQSINGKSLIKFPNSMKTFDFIKFLTQIRIENMTNHDNKNFLKMSLNNENIDETYIMNYLEENQSNTDDFINNIEKQTKRKDLSKKQIHKKIKLILNKEDNKNQRLIDNLKRTNLFNNLNNPRIIDNLKKEKEIVIILDNFSVHNAKLVEKASKILNIKLINLPPYSPKYNPIEQIWRSIKKRLSILVITNKKQLIEEFQSIYNEIIKKESYYLNWKEKFII